MISHKDVKKSEIIHYTLIAITTIVISVCLYLSYIFTGKYQEAVSLNDYLSTVRLQLRLAETAASEVNIPGNRIFESRDSEGERRELRHAGERFDKLWRDFSGVFQHNEIGFDAQLVGEKLRIIEDKMVSMIPK